MSLVNNPLKQYFRRPAIYLKLPSGGALYPPGVINLTENGELPVYPMTAIDEITTKTPDALFNGVAMVDIIKSCIPDVLDPWSINSIDLDAILLAIKSAAGGNEMEIESQCPSCNEVASYGVNLIGILSELKAGNYDSTLQLNELALKFRPLTYKEMNQAGLGQFEVQRMFASLDTITDEVARAERGKLALKTITELTMQLLSQTIEHITTPTVKVDDKEFIIDFLKNCDKDMYMKIRDYNAELKAQTEIKPLKIKCIHCSHDYEQQFTLNTTDFFG
jgi:hypothetical protein